MLVGGSLLEDVGDKSLSSFSDSPAVRVIESFADDVETSQRQVLVQEQPQVEITVSDRSAALVHPLCQLAASPVLAV